MLNDITLGQYYPTRSLIHKLDPRVKIVLTLLIMVMLFTAKGVFSYVFVALFVMLVIILSKVPPAFIFRGLKPLWFIVVFTAAINIFLTDGQIIFKIGFLKATYEGVNMAVMMVVRLMLLVTVTTLLTLTTSPIMLTDGIESLLKPLKKIRFPAHELAMMMTIALRFIPTLIEETDKIIKAQSARGADFTSGSLIKRVKAMVPILVPLFISAFRRADELASAMECRCYRGDVNRTRMKQLKTAKHDYIAASVCVVCFAVVLILNKVGQIF